MRGCVGVRARESMGARRAGAPVRGWARVHRCVGSCPGAYLGEWLVGARGCVVARGAWVRWKRGKVLCFHVTQLV